MKKISKAIADFSIKIKEKNMASSLSPLIITPSGTPYLLTCNKILEKTELEQLLPYIKKLIEQSGRSELKSIKDRLIIKATSATEAAFVIEDSTENDEESLKSLERLCTQKLAEKIAIPVFTTPPSYLRPLRFNYQSGALNAEHIIVASNPLEDTMKLIGKLVPLDISEKDSKSKEKASGYAS